MTLPATFPSLTTGCPGRDAVPRRNPGALLARIVTAGLVLQAGWTNSATAQPSPFDPDTATTLPDVPVRPPAGWNPYPRFSRPIFRPNPGGGGGGGAPWDGGDTDNSPPSPFNDNPGDNEQVRDAGEGDCGASPSAGNPVVIGTGNKIESELDFAAEGELGLSLRRTYNHYWSHHGIFGKHWLSSFDYSLVPQGSGVLWAQRPDGRRIKFLWHAGQQRWNEDKAQPVAYIVKNPDDSYTHHTEEHTVERYNPFGYVLAVKNRQDIGWTFSYSGNYLQQVAHTSGRKVLFGWTGNQLTKVTDPDGKIYVYTYDANAFGANKHRLKSVVLPGAPATTVAYHYEKPALPGALTGKSFNGARYSTFDYDAWGRATLSQHAGIVDRHVYDYTGAVDDPGDPPPPPPPPGGECNPVTHVCTHPQSVDDPPDDLAALAQREAIAQAADAVLLAPLADAVVTVTNPLNKQATYEFADGRLTTVTGHPSTWCAGSYRERGYDGNGNEDQVEDFNGNVVDFDYAANGQLQKRVEGLGTAQARTTSYQWDVVNNRIVKTTVAGDHEASYAYTADHRLQSVTVKNLSAHGTPNQTRTTSYGYTKHPNGLVATMTVDGPLPGAGDAVTYHYSAQGDLVAAVNALGHTTSYSQHNGRGQPGRATGPNGEGVEYQYDARGRVTRLRTFRAGGQQDTVYAYNGAGLLEKITTPDGVTESYVYDNARRLKEIQRNEPDGQARKVLTYNAHSQVVREDIFRGNTLRFRTYTDYDELGRVRARRGTHGQHVKFGYDPNDNLTAVTDSLNKTTTFEYDPLNRRKTQIDPLGGITHFAYDAGHRIKQVTDPRNLVTTYAFDGFGQLRTQVSPDSGTTTHAWDAAGRLTGTTRQDGVTVSFGHDALGRRTSISAGGQTQTFTWDTCLNGKGRPCFAGGPGYAENLSYSPYGEIAARQISHTGYGASFDHGFQHDALGRLTKIVYPNGVEANYTYTLDKVTSLTVKIGGQTKTVANGLQYEPMGPMKELAFGNGGGRKNHFDSDYRLSDIETNLKVGYHFDFDANDRIDGYTNFAEGLWSYDFGYDELHRLKTANSPGLGNQAFTYDANGNRKTHGATNYTIANNSNRLMSLSGGMNRTYTYTQTGNVKTITGFGVIGGDSIFKNGFQIEQPPTTTFTYGPFDKLSGVTGPGLTASYETGPDGTRFKKTVNGQVTDFTYGPNGMLISEHRRSPLQWTNYLWLDGKPVAMVRGNTLYWIQTDHLGRPEGVTDQNKQRKWRAATMPFGRRVIDDFIGGFHLGFPGQYHDAETGFVHNINRDLDSLSNRYLQVDPIGLAGGINPYAYAANNPVMSIDPLGLTCNAAGCWVTGAEQAYADTGNYSLYYQAACSGGDPYACRAGEVAANQGFLSGITNQRLANSIARNLPNGTSCKESKETTEEKMEAIRKTLAQAHAQALRGASPSSPRMLDRWKDIARFHDDVFFQYGADAVFGGRTYDTLFGRGGFGYDWCPSPSCQ